MLQAPLIPKLRGHFAEFLNNSSLAHLGAFTPDYLCWFSVRAADELTLEAFLGSMTRTSCDITAQPCQCADLPAHRPHCLYRNPLTGMYLPSPSLHQSISRYRNFNLLSIDYAFRPRLRSRLTLGGRAFPRKPWSFGGRDSHPSCATYTGILTSSRSTTPYGMASPQLERSPTIESISIHSFGNTFSPVTFSAQRHSTSGLLRTL